MEIVGITGEFNNDSIATLGIIAANKHFTPPSRMDRDHVDLQTNTRWFGRLPPVDWPLEKYSISYREGDPSATELSIVGLDPPIFATPVYFVDLKDRHFTSIQAYGNVAAEEPCEREFSGFDFTFTDGSTETVDHISHQAPSTGISIRVEMEEDDNITDMILHFALMTNDSDCPSGLCGIQFTTNSNRVFELGHMEDHPCRQRSLAQDHQEENETICGLQIGLKPFGIASMWLVFWRS